MYKISAVIPAYNRESTIKRCIDSVMNQTYPAYEIIVADDGSTDRTLDIISEEFGDRVKIVRQDHKGAQAARNAGIRAAQGEYIAFLDSDDEWLPDKLKLQAQELDKDRDLLVCGDGYVQTDWLEDVPLVWKEKFGGKRCRPGARRALRMNGKSGYVYKDILKRSFCLFPGILVSKKNLSKAGLLDEKVPSCQEWDTAIRLAKICEFSYIHKPLFVYHLHDDVTISKNTKRGIDGLEYICDKYQTEIISQLGSIGMTQKYKGLMKMCIGYKDKRFIKYFFKYILGKINVFIIKQSSD